MLRKDYTSRIPFERLIPAKNGYTVSAGEITLHSRYDPMLEAEKYIASLRLEKPYQYFILIEPALGYMAAVLERRFPQAEVIILHCSAFYSNEKLCPLWPGDFESRIAVKAPSWNPSCQENLENFLDRTIGTAEPAEIRLIEWKPSVNAYGKLCADLAARTVDCIRRIAAGKNTVRNFGRRWLRNALRNLPLLRNPAEFNAGMQPILICAAGPCLEDFLPAIAEWKQSPAPPFLIAVSSAAPALLYRKIIPDIIIAVDGGPWALLHLFESLRGMKNTDKRPVIAAALTASLPSQTENWPILILGDGSLWQELLLRSCGKLPFKSFPQRGTVSASALDLALLLTGGNIYFAGLDFSHRDIKTHARPYAFDKIPENAASRLTPQYSLTFEREAAINKSGSLGIYAAWFKTHLNYAASGRLYALGGPSLLGIPQAELPLKDGTEIEKTAEITFTVNCGFNPPGKKPGAALLLDALDTPLTAKQTKQELAELLFPGFSMQDGDLSGKLKKALVEIANGQANI
jgi:hypothetical protein